MTDMATKHGPGLEESRETSPDTSVPTSTETQALITEQQVLFSTAATVALPTAKTRWWSRHHPRRHRSAARDVRSL